MKDIFQRELDGEEIQTDDPKYEKLTWIIRETMNTLTEFNCKAPFDENNKKLIAKVMGKNLDDSNAILPPFYTDCGKNITIGNRVFIGIDRWKEFPLKREGVWKEEY